MIRVIENITADEWNSVVEHPMQSWEWGEVRKKLGIEVLRIGEFTKNKLVGGFQITIHKLPTTKYQVAYVPRSQMPSEEVLEFLYGWAKKNKIIFIKFEPYEEKLKVKSQKSKVQLKIQKSGHRLFPDWTIILDLKPNEENLLKKMRPKTRYNIRLAEKKGVTVKEMTNKEGFRIFSDLYFATMKRQKYFGHSRDYHKTVFESLKNKMAHILVAYYNNKPLAAYELFIFKDHAYYPYGGSSLEDKNVMAPNVLMWESIKFAKNKGCKYFDMWGASSPNAPENDIYAGFTRFKEGYGGDFVEMIGSYDLVINYNLYRIYNLVYRLRNLWLNLVS